MASTRRQQLQEQEAGRAAWSYRAGAKGENRVRVFERSGAGRKTGIWIDYRDEDGARHRAPLGTTDRDAAKLKADEVAAQFRREGARHTAVLTLETLFENYGREVTPTKSESARAHDVRTSQLLLRFLGPDRRPETLSRREWDAYIRARRSGKLRPPKVKERQNGWRVIEQDLSFLNAVLNWGTQAGDGRGRFLLERNPLKGLPVPTREPTASAPDARSVRGRARGRGRDRSAA